MPHGSLIQTTAEFWRGPFGDSYTARNAIQPEHVAARVNLWSDILVATGPDRPRTLLEIGAGAGINLRALRVELGKTVRIFAVEPNKAARAALIDSGVLYETDVYPDTSQVVGTVDLVFTSGVLIHIPPADLLDFCRGIHRRAGKWIAAIEYFAAEPEEKPYRGHAGRLWKRDFGSFWLDNFPDLRAVGCGFAWKRMTGLDDLTWWLLEKH